MPEFNAEKCDGCGLCVSVCYCGALQIVNNRLSIAKTEKCGWCAQCEAICPTGAIRCPYEIIMEEVE